MKLKTIHCSTPAQKGFTITTRPCSIATEQLKEVRFNPCLNREWGDSPRNDGKGKSLRSQKTTVHRCIRDKPRVTEVCAPPSTLDKWHPRERHQLKMQAGELFTTSKHQSAFLISMQCINKCRSGLVFSIFSPIAGQQCLRCSILTTAFSKGRL